MIKPELILPAGNHEKASYAMAYGADAVYAGVPGLSLRTKYISFDEFSLGKAIEEAHTSGKRFYVACNLFAHETDLGRLERFLDVIEGYGPDALIVSDPGVVRIIRKQKITIPIHISTQANATNSQAIQFWREEGNSFKRSFAIVEFTYSEGGQRYFALKKIDGNISDLHHEEQLRTGKQIPEKIIIDIFSNYKFYDADPPLIYMLELIYDHTLTTFPEESEYDAVDSKQYPVVNVSLE